MRSCSYGMGIGARALHGVNERGSEFQGGGIEGLGLRV